MSRFILKLFYLCYFIVFYALLTKNSGFVLKSFVRNSRTGFKGRRKTRWLLFKPICTAIGLFKSRSHIERFQENLWSNISYFNSDVPTFIRHLARKKKG